jgi:hypothetical protein
MALELFREVRQEIERKSDVVICVTTGGHPLMTPEERMAGVRFANVASGPTTRPLTSFIRHGLVQPRLVCHELSPPGLSLATPGMMSCSFP